MEQALSSGGDVRAELARRRVPIYILAARVRLHPVRLARFLNRSLPLPPELAARIQTALTELVAEGQAR